MQTMTSELTTIKAYDLCPNWPSMCNTHLTIDPSTGFAVYKSSEVERYFCSICGANVLYRHVSEPMVCDLPVALIDTVDEPEKQTLDGWLDLGQKVASADDTLDGKFKRALLEGVKGNDVQGQP
jgi:hypothetical protein